MPLSITTNHSATEHNATEHNATEQTPLSITPLSLKATQKKRPSAQQCHFAEYRSLFIGMQSVIMLRVIMQNVVMLCVIMLNVVMLCVIILCVVMLKVIMLKSWRPFKLSFRNHFTSCIILVVTFENEILPIPFFLVNSFLLRH